MPIKIGQNGTEAKYIYYGSNKIKEVYNGSNLLYSDGIPVWKFTRSGTARYLVGEYNTNGYSAAFANEPAIAIDSMTGTLGTSGSTISFGEYVYTFVSTTTIAGKVAYRYSNTQGLLPTYAYALEGSVVGSYCIITTDSIEHPTNVQESSMVWNTYTYTRDMSYFKKWSKNGVN